MSWLAAIRRYLIAVSLGNLLWETAQLPLYTLWQTGTPATIMAAVLHCTAGDVLIAALTLVAALVVFGSSNWPRAGFARVAMTAVALGVDPRCSADGCTSASITCVSLRTRR
jgi:hypothetical protein